MKIRLEKHLSYALLILVTAMAFRLSHRVGWLGPFRELAEPCNVVDPTGRTIFCTSLPVSVGDQYLGSGNMRYVVVETGKGFARARPAADGEPPYPEVGPCLASPSAASEAIPLGVVSRVCVIYHTHTDESYISEGSSLQPGRGGVLSVGEAFAASLKKAGFAVVHDKTRHEPHDALAYVRSRRTAYANLKYRPYLLFDVHRDAAPQEYYTTVIDGAPSAQILIVVGRQNPLMAANLLVAKKLKAVADQVHPGLVKGIFLAMGHYNQDLDPGALLLEVGSDRVPLELARRAIMLFTDAVAAAFGAPGV